jgi:hypothetical protein
MRHNRSNACRWQRFESQDPVCATKNALRCEVQSGSRATRIELASSARPTGWLCVENRAVIHHGNRPPGGDLHIRIRQESWLVSLPEELQSDELRRAITSGRSTACRLHANSTICHPINRNRARLFCAKGVRLHLKPGANAPPGELIGLVPAFRVIS